MNILIAALAAAVVAAPVAPVAQPAPTISPERLSQTVRVLASDAFEGRAPGTAGETRTVDWLVAQLKALGMEPGGPGGAWTQAVPLVHTRMGKGTLRVSIGGRAVPLVAQRDISIGTARPVDRVVIRHAPMVFVGYGVTAPERHWDDFKGVDLKGKVAVFLVNDPDFEAMPGEPVAGIFGGRRMTYYGRWTYKYEEAARRGAIAALIVHDTEGAGYGWSTVLAGSGETYALVQRDPDAGLSMQGWIEGQAATRLFRAAGLDLAALRARARRADFRPVELKGATLDVDYAVAQERLESRNVLAKLTGATRPDEAVLYGAHWDAYGIGAPDAEGRVVRPGANDDALGVAGLLEIARAFKAAKRPARTVLFGFWTAEERGLLGSEAYAAHPLYPADKMVANITLDILQTAGPARDVLLVGDGQNDLEKDLSVAAAAQGRRVTPETLPERGLFYRADHFPFARRGVPTLLLMGISGPPDLVSGGRQAGEAWLKAYMACYHQPCDAWSAEWDLRGAADDVGLAYTVGRDLADSTRWPGWSAASEFRR